MKTKKNTGTYRGRGMKLLAGRGITALLLSAVVALYLPFSAYAATHEYDIANYDITVNAGNDGIRSVQKWVADVATTDENIPLEDEIIIISGSENAVDHFLIINSEGTGEYAAHVTLQDVNISPTSDHAAITIEGNGDVVIELNGSNEIASGGDHAGLEKNNDENYNLTIQDESGDSVGSLTATGGRNGGAGIGGAKDEGGENITITGGEITAKGGDTGTKDTGAGIGGGAGGDGTNIVISGGKVTATGGNTNIKNTGAGIGGGAKGDGSDINITGGEVIATGGNVGSSTGEGANGSAGAGIGGGAGGDGIDIAINDGTVTATGGKSYSGGDSGAGIGGGGSIRTVSGSLQGDGTYITISGGTVTATGGDTPDRIEGGAGIGGGHGGDGDTIIVSGGHVTAQGGKTAAGIGGGSTGNGMNITFSGGTTIAVGSIAGAGIGGGVSHDAESVTISGDANVYAAGGAEKIVYSYHKFGAGAAIGGGGVYSSEPSEELTHGSPLEPDTTGHTGILVTFPAGTTIDQIKDYIANPPVDPDPIIPDDDPVDKPDDNGNKEDPYVLQPVIPVDVIEKDVLVVDWEEYKEESGSDDAENSKAVVDFQNAIISQLDELIRQVMRLIKEGRLEEANLILKNGITINAGTNRCLSGATIAKIAEASKAGIPVKINFINEGTAYSVIIPGSSIVDTKTLVNNENCCGFLNLLKTYGGTKIAK